MGRKWALIGILIIKSQSIGRKHSFQVYVLNFHSKMACFGWTVAVTKPKMNRKFRFWRFSDFRPNLGTHMDNVAEILNSLKYESWVWVDRNFFQWILQQEYHEKCEKNDLFEVFWTQLQILGRKWALFHIFWLAAFNLYRLRPNRLYLMEFLRIWSIIYTYIFRSP